MVDPAQEEMRAKLEAWRESRRAAALASGHSVNGKQRPPMMGSSPPQLRGAGGGPRQQYGRSTRGHRPLSTSLSVGTVGSENDAPTPRSAVSMPAPDTVSKRLEAGLRHTTQPKGHASAGRPLGERSPNMAFAPHARPPGPPAAAATQRSQPPCPAEAPEAQFGTSGSYASEMASATEAFVAAFSARGPLVPPPSPVAGLGRWAHPMVSDDIAGILGEAVELFLESRPTGESPRVASACAAEQFQEVTAACSASACAVAPGSPAGSQRSLNSARAGSSHSAGAFSVPLSPLSLDDRDLDEEQSSEEDEGGDVRAADAVHAAPFQISLPLPACAGEVEGV